MDDAELAPASSSASPSPHVHKQYAEEVPAPRGPLTVAAGTKKTGNPPTVKVHLLMPNGSGVGCGWQPPKGVQQLADPGDITKDMVRCIRCFKFYDFPKSWLPEQDPNLPRTESPEPEDMSDASDTASSDDTESEKEVEIFDYLAKEP